MAVSIGAKIGQARNVQGRTRFVHDQYRPELLTSEPRSGGIYFPLTEDHDCDLSDWKVNVGEAPIVLAPNPTFTIRTSVLLGVPISISILNLQ